MAVLMGLDLGQKRIGVSISDETETVATPLQTILYRNRKQVLADLTQIMDQYRVAKIIVGMPKTLKGEVGISAQKVTEQVEWFKRFIDKPWIFWDERLSTQEIERVLLAADVSRGRRKMVRDKLAAQRILQNYLDWVRFQERTS